MEGASISLRKGTPFLSGINWWYWPTAKDPSQKEGGYIEGTVPVVRPETVPLKPCDMVGPTHFLPEDHMEVRNLILIKGSSRSSAEGWFPRCARSQGKDPEFLKRPLTSNTVGAEHIPYTPVNLRRPWSVVGLWGKLLFFLRDQGTIGLGGEALRQVRECFQLGNISRFFPRQWGQQRTWEHKCQDGHTVCSLLSA